MKNGIAVRPTRKSVTAKLATKQLKTVRNFFSVYNDIKTTKLLQTVKMTSIQRTTASESFRQDSVSLGVAFAVTVTTKSVDAIFFLQQFDYSFK